MPAETWLAAAAGTAAVAVTIDIHWLKLNMEDHQLNYYG